MAASTSQKCREDKGNDLLYIEYIVQYLILNRPSANDVFILVSLQPHSALHLWDRQPNNIFIKAKIAKGALQISYSNSLVLQMGSPKRVGSLTSSSMANLVAAPRFKPRFCHSPSSALSCAIMEGAAGPQRRIPEKPS